MTGASRYPFAKILPLTLRRDGELSSTLSFKVVSGGKNFSNPQLVNSAASP
jgi:hypothetical protein